MPHINIAQQLLPNSYAATHHKEKPHFKQKHRSNGVVSQISPDTQYNKSLQPAQVKTKKSLFRYKVSTTKNTKNSAIKLNAHTNSTKKNTKFKRLVNTTKKIALLLPSIYSNLGTLLRTVDSVIHIKSFNIVKAHHSTQPLLATSIAFDSLGSIHNASHLAMQVVEDKKIWKTRILSQDIAKTYNPAIYLHRRRKSFKLLKKLSLNRKVNVMRSNKQILIDRLLQVKHLAVSNIALLNVTLSFVGKFVSFAAPILPGISLLVTCVYYTMSILSSIMHIIALNNLASAESLTEDTLLLSLAKHIKQERLTEARREIATSLIGSIQIFFEALGLAGISYPISFAFTFTLNLLNTIISGIHDFSHQKKLKKQRENTPKISIKNPAYLAASKHNIGAAETLFLHRLRNSQAKKIKRRS